MRRALYIVLVLVMAAACGPHRIPRDDMEDILYRMLVQDQQIRQDPQLRKQADTMLVYEGISRPMALTRMTSCTAWSTTWRSRPAWRR